MVVVGGWEALASLLLHNLQTSRLPGEEPLPPSRHRWKAQPTSSLLQTLSGLVLSVL